jgi:4-aminobutyrate aminotransferase-like enzyme
MQTYTVTNKYGIKGETTHRTAEAAIKAASKREGEGWMVVDEDGNQWVDNGSGRAVKL